MLPADREQLHCLENVVGLLLKLNVCCFQHEHLLGVAAPADCVVFTVQLRTRGESERSERIHSDSDLDESKPQFEMIEVTCKQQSVTEFNVRVPQSRPQVN